MKAFPEILSFIRDMIMQYHSPLGLSPNTLGSWCQKPNNSLDGKKSKKVLYSGGLHVMMAIIDRLRHVLPLMMKDPSKEGRIKLLRKFTFINKRTLPMLSWHAKLKEIPRKALEILHYLGHEDITCLPEEPYNGSLLLELGFKQDAVAYGEFLRDYFKEQNVEEIIVIDPHTFEMLAHFYPQNVKEFDFKVVLIHDLLLRHLDAFRMQKDSSSIRVTYHDPCIYSKRLSNPIIEQPREIMSQINGLELIEAFNHGRRSRCCGGPVELLFLELSKEISRDRLEHLSQTGARMIMTSCPICYISFNRVKKRADEFIIKDLIEFLHENLVKRGHFS